MPRVRTAYRTPVRSAPSVSLGATRASSAPSLPAKTVVRKKRRKQRKRALGVRGGMPLSNQPKIVPQPSRRSQ